MVQKDLIWQGNILEDILKTLMDFSGARRMKAVRDGFYRFCCLLQSFLTCSRDAEDEPTSFESAWPTYCTKNSQACFEKSVSLNYRCWRLESSSAFTKIFWSRALYADFAFPLDELPTFIFAFTQCKAILYKYQYFLVKICILANPIEVLNLLLTKL